MTDDLSLRRLTPAGIDEWTAYLAAAKADPAVEVPTGLLDDPKLSEPVADVPVPALRFETRREAADVLTELLSGLPESEVEKDVGLWDWLTLRYFDSVAPPAGGRRSLYQPFCYHFSPDDHRLWYRHRLFIAWEVKRLAGQYDRLFLDRELASLDKFTELAFRRLSYTRLPNMPEVIDRIYFDVSKNQPRTGTAFGGSDTDFGTRFPRRLDQLELTYDLHSLSADRLIELLGPEFQALDHGGTASAPAAKAKPAKRRRIPVTVS